MTPAERYEQIIRWRKGRVSKVEIARRLGIHPTRVGQILRAGPPTKDVAAPLELDPLKDYGHLRYAGPAERPPGKPKGRYAKFFCQACLSVAVLPVRRVVYGNNTSCGCKARNKPRRES